MFDNYLILKFLNKQIEVRMFQLSYVAINACSYLSAQQYLVTLDRPLPTATFCSL